MFDVEIYADYVIFRGVRLDRPAIVTPAQWTDYWHRAETFKR